MTKFLSIGEVMLEMADVGDGLYRKSFAGDTFNVAHYLSEVTKENVQIDYLTAVGTDAQSTACLDFLHQHGVGTSRCVKDPSRTIGLFLLSNDSAGEKQYGYWRGQSAVRHLFDELQDLSGYDWIYLSGITGAVTENKELLVNSLKLAREQKAQVAYDFNYRGQLWTPLEAVEFAAAVLGHCDVVKISDEELDVLYPDQGLEVLSTLYPNAEWVLTCGGEKGEVWRGGNLIASQIFQSVESVVDSSAAGDSFIAAYIGAKLEDGDPKQGLRRGHAVASQVVCCKGSIVPLDLTKLD